MASSKNDKRREVDDFLPTPDDSTPLTTPVPGPTPHVPKLQITDHPTRLSDDPLDLRVSVVKPPRLFYGL